MLFVQPDSGERMTRSYDLKILRRSSCNTRTVRVAELGLTQSSGLTTAVDEESFNDSD